MNVDILPDTGKEVREAWMLTPEHVEERIVEALNTVCGLLHTLMAMLIVVPELNGKFGGLVGTISASLTMDVGILKVPEELIVSSSNLSEIM